MRLEIRIDIDIDQRALTGIRRSTRAGKSIDRATNELVKPRAPRTKIPRQSSPAAGNVAETRRRRGQSPAGVCSCAAMATRLLPDASDCVERLN